MALLGQLPQAEVAVAAPAEETVDVSESQVEEIGEKVLAAFAVEPVEETPAVEEPVQNVIAEESAPEPAPVDVYPEGDPFADTLESTRRINLTDLKFGRNYTGEED